MKNKIEFSELHKFSLELSKQRIGKYIYDSKEKEIMEIITFRNKKYKEFQDEIESSSSEDEENAISSRFREAMRNDYFIASDPNLWQINIAIIGQCKKLEDEVGIKIKISNQAIGFSFVVNPEDPQNEDRFYRHYDLILLTGGDKILVQMVNTRSLMDWGKFNQRFNCTLSKEEYKNLEIKNSEELKKLLLSTKQKKQHERRI